MGKDIRRSCNIKQFLLSPLWVKKLHNSCLQCRRPGFDPWVRKIPWRGKWQPILVLLPGKSHGQRSLVDYSPWDLKESDTTSDFTFTFFQYSREFCPRLSLFFCLFFFVVVVFFCELRSFITYDGAIHYNSHSPNKAYKTKSESVWLLPYNYSRTKLENI